MYQIKTVSSLTGINTDTVRAWERRYQAIVPSRDQSGRRVYTEENIERLKLLAGTLRQGYSIGKVANLDNAALKKLLNNNEFSVDSYDEMIIQVLQSLKRYELDRCEELIRRAMISLPPLDFAENILAPAMYQVGELWHKNQISIAQEHMFSACVQRMLYSLINNMIPLTKSGQSMIFSTLSGENHEFGILLTSFLAANNRLTCHYLGTDLPAEEIMKVNQKIKADVVLISLINSPPTKDIIEQLNFISSNNEQSQIWTGGIGAQNLYERNLLPKSFEFIENLKDFNQRVMLLIS